MGEVKFVVTGDYIEKIITQFGTVSAFVIGAKLAAGFLVKHPMSLTGKVGTSLLTGGASSATFKMVSLGNGIIRGQVEAKEMSNNTLRLDIQNVEICLTPPSSIVMVMIAEKKMEGYQRLKQKLPKESLIIYPILQIS